MKNKKIYLSSIFLIFLFILSVYGDIDSLGTTFEQIEQNGYAYSVWDASNPKTEDIHYSNYSSRFYAFYPRQIGSSTYDLDYSYSDVDDLTSWNSGSSIASSYQTIAGSYSGCAYGISFDAVLNENGTSFYIAYAVTQVNDDYLYMKRFSVNEVTGVLSAEETNYMFHYQYSRKRYSVQILLDENEYPVIVANIRTAGTNDLWFLWSDSQTPTGAGGNFTKIKEDMPFIDFEVKAELISNSTILAVCGTWNTDETLFYCIFENGVTTNGTITNSAFTTDNIKRYDYAAGDFNYQDWSFFSYDIIDTDNRREGCLFYVNTTNHAKVFTFDLDDVTNKSDVYVLLSGNASSYYPKYTDVTSHNDEFFLASNYHYYGYSDYNQELWFYEEKTESGDYFNSSVLWLSNAETWLTDDWDSKFTYAPFNLFTTSNGTIVCYTLDNSAYVGVYYGEIEGEDLTPPEEEELSSIDNNLIFIIGGFISFFTILFLIVKAKKDLM